MDVRARRRNQTRYQGHSSSTLGPLQTGSSAGRPEMALAWSAHAATSELGCALRRFKGACAGGTSRNSGRLNVQSGVAIPGALSHPSGTAHRIHVRRRDTVHAKTFLRCRYYERFRAVHTAGGPCTDAVHRPLADTQGHDVPLGANAVGNGGGARKRYHRLWVLCVSWARGALRRSRSRLVPRRWAHVAGCC